jgi:hypothetical protein
MRVRFVLRAILLCLIMSWTVLAPSQSAAQTSPAESGHPSTGLYSDTIDGLQIFLKSLVAVIETHDVDVRSRAQQTLIVPNFHKWFASVYGPHVAQESAGLIYSKEPDLWDLVHDCRLKEWEITVTRTKFADVQSAQSSGIYFLRGMKHPIPVYTVYTTDPQSQSVCVVNGLFVYVDHGFRVVYSSNYPEIDEQQRPRCGLSGSRLQTFRAGSSIMQAKLISPDAPIPFPDGNKSRISEKVVLGADIACDGTVLRTWYVSGPPSLFRAASEAAKKRQYHQSLFNGEPAQVRTDIVIVFAPA